MILPKEYLTQNDGLFLITFVRLPSQTDGLSADSRPSAGALAMSLDLDKRAQTARPLFQPSLTSVSLSSLQSYELNQASFLLLPCVMSVLLISPVQPINLLAFARRPLYRTRKSVVKYEHIADSTMIRW